MTSRFDSEDQPPAAFSAKARPTHSHHQQQQTSQYHQQQQQMPLSYAAAAAPHPAGHGSPARFFLPHASAAAHPDEGQTPGGVMSPTPDERFGSHAPALRGAAGPQYDRSRVAQAWAQPAALHTTGSHHAAAAYAHHAPPVPSPMYSKENKPNKSAPLSVLGVRIRAWWSTKGDLAKAIWIAVGILLGAALLLVVALSSAPITSDGERAGLAALARAHTPFAASHPSAALLKALAPGAARPVDDSSHLSWLTRMRKLVKRIARQIGAVERPPKKLGDFRIGGAAGRSGLAPTPGSPLLQGENALATHTPIMNALLSKAAFEKHLATQATTVAAEIAREQSKVSASSNAAAVFSPNPWSTRSAFSSSGSTFASMTFFAVFPELNMRTAAAGSKSGVTSIGDPNSPQGTQLTMSLLVLSAWVQLVPAEKIHVFVPNAETCLVLVGHDGTPLGRDAAIAADSSASAEQANPLASIHCHVFPCTHGEFGRPQMNCVWNDMALYADKEQQERREGERRMHEETAALLRKTRPLTESEEAALQQALADVDATDELLVYLSPTILFDVQLLAALTKLSDEALATAALVKRIRASASAAGGGASSEWDLPHQGLDEFGARILDGGHFLAIGRKTDVAIPRAVLSSFQVAAQAPGRPEHEQGKHTHATAAYAAAMAAASLFHAPATGFSTLVADALEGIWQAAYSPKGGVLHSPFGLDFMCIRLDTYRTLQQHHAQRARDADDEEDSAHGGGGSGRGSASADPDAGERARTLAAAAKLPSSSQPAASPSPSYFPPFLVGLFRWENWLVSDLILRREPFTTKVVDLTAAVTLVHVEIAVESETAIGRSEEKPSESEASLAAAGAKYNEQLVQAVSGNAYRIGSVDFAPFQLVGSCVLERIRPTPMEAGKGATSSVAIATAADISASGSVSLLSPTLLAPLCLVQQRAPSNVSNLYWFTRQASRAPLPTNYLIVLTVNSGYLELALNWLCWARRIRFTNYILLAEDQSSARIFRALGAPVVVPSDAAEDLPPADYGSVAFQRTMSFRTEFLLSVLLAGFHFVTADMDAIWFDNPIPSFDVQADLTGQTHKGYKLSGGFIVVRSTPYGRYFWSRVIECQRMNAEFLAKHEEGTYEPSAYTEQFCINELSLGLEKKQTQPPFTRALLDPYAFPDGKSFFDQRNSQYRGIWPIVIHNNWIMFDGKFARMLNWSMVSIAPITEDGGVRLGGDHGAPMGGLERAKAAGIRLKQTETGVITGAQAEMTERDLAVCTAEAEIRREPVPVPSFRRMAADRFLGTGSAAAVAAEIAQHPFHMHIRLFLSAIASDGVEQAHEFDALQQSLRGLMSADYTGVVDAAGRPVRPTLHLELMLDHLTTNDQRQASHPGEVAEFERLKPILKQLKAQWSQWTAGSVEGARHVFEVKRPKVPADEKVRLRKVGPLGLWTLPWPKVAGSTEEQEGREASEANAATTANEQHHDVALYLQDSVELSKQWFKVAYAALQAYYVVDPPASGAASSPSSASSSPIDPRIYGVSLLDAHEIYGESVSITYSADRAYVDRRFAEVAYFNRTKAAWAQVRQAAERRKETPPHQFVLHKYFGYQYLSDAGAVLLFPQHFDNFVTWLAQQNVVDTYSSRAVPPKTHHNPLLPAGSPPLAASKCIPTLVSNRLLIGDQPQERTWKEWINRWAYERGFYALHERARTAKVVTVAAGRDTEQQQQRVEIDWSTRHVVARTAGQKVDRSIKLLDHLTPTDLLLPALSSLPVLDFHFVPSRHPITLAYRSILSPAGVVDPCYTVDQLATRMAENDAVEAEQARVEKARKQAINDEKKRIADAIKAAEKAVKDAAKKAQADAKKAAAEAKKAADAEKKASEAATKKKEAAAAVTTETKKPAAAAAKSTSPAKDKKKSPEATAAAAAAAKAKKKSPTAAKPSGPAAGADAAKKKSTAKPSGPAAKPNSKEQKQKKKEAEAEAEAE